MIERFQLEAAARPLEVSEAQRLRCAVARALVAGPKMLLLDEREYDEALLREVSPLPALLVTNDLDLCCSAAQQMIVLDAGRILLRGAPRDVIDRPETLEAARLLGFSNLFEGTISALDPGRNSSRIECARFALSAPYLPGHFRGDRVWVAVRAENLRVHSGEIEGVNCVSAQLVRVSHRTRSVRLEFAGPVVAEIPPERFAPEKDNKSWSVEFPVDALRII
jgi:ABC-type sulfate/molybdate transport systems ATPase subunit